MEREPPKQRLTTLEQFLERIQKQALAEAARTRQKVILAAARKSQSVCCLIDIGMTLGDDLTERLDTDREFLQGWDDGHFAFRRLNRVQREMRNFHYVFGLGDFINLGGDAV